MIKLNRGSNKGKDQAYQRRREKFHAELLQYGCQSTQQLREVKMCILKENTTKIRGLSQEDSAEIRAITSQEDAKIYRTTSSAPAKIEQDKPEEIDRRLKVQPLTMSNKGKGQTQSQIPC
jgi:hypothetical protein